MQSWALTKIPHPIENDQIYHLLIALLGLQHKPLMLNLPSAKLVRMSAVVSQSQNVRSCGYSPVPAPYRNHRIRQRPQSKVEFCAWVVAEFAGQMRRKSLKSLNINVIPFGKAIDLK